MGAKIRELQGFGLEEGVSSRLLVYVGQLICQGLDPVDAASHAIAHTLTDDVEVRGSIVDIIRLYFGELAEIADVESEHTRG